MGIKQKIHDIFFHNTFLKKIYCVASYVKGKISCCWKLVTPIVLYKALHSQPVFLVFTPEHANLGDHAIAYAETKMFNRLGIHFFEITGHQLYVLRHYDYLKMLNRATVFVNGGGNLGTLWPDIESMNRSLIEQLPDATICFFPNSIYYEDSPNGRDELQKSVEIYNKHPKLFLYAREELSFSLMKSLYRHVKFSPDMVLSLAPNLDSSKRSGCLICMRGDVERTVSAADYKTICSMTTSYFRKVNFTNTVLDHNVSVRDREVELYKKLQEFSRAELVITDRLHGMIFCAITGTKCIVLGGKSPKIKGCYEYLQGLGFIDLVNSAEEIFPKYEKLIEFPHNSKLPMKKIVIQNLECDVCNLINNSTWDT